MATPDQEEQLELARRSVDGIYSRAEVREIERDEGDRQLFLTRITEPHTPTYEELERATLTATVREFAELEPNPTLSVEEIGIVWRALGDEAWDHHVLDRITDETGLPEGRVLMVLIKTKIDRYAPWQD